jgi:hypothetical protein
MRTVCYRDRNNKISKDKDLAQTGLKQTVYKDESSVKKESVFANQ